jgi:DNA-binding MarR family transcriptional regulator
MAFKKTIVPETHQFDQIFSRLSEHQLDVDPNLIRIAYRIIDFSTFTLAATESYLARFGLSQGRFVILLLLYKLTESTWTPARLADLIGVSRATITGLLNTLEKDRWIERRPLMSDRRMKEVVLTESGRAKIQEFLPGHIERISELIAKFSEDEIDTLLNLLNKVRIAFSSL